MVTGISRATLAGGAIGTAAAIATIGGLAGTIGDGEHAEANRGAYRALLGAGVATTAALGAAWILGGPRLHELGMVGTGVALGLPAMLGTGLIQNDRDLSR